jgi:hypothetical protein
MWRESRRMEPRHAWLGGCLTCVAACGTGGVVFCFGSQLLLGALIGGVAAFVNHQQGWVAWRQVVGVAPAPTQSPGDPAGQSPLLPLNTPSVRAGALGLAIGLLASGIYFWGAGTARSLEGLATAGDFACTAPCGMQHGLWVQVVPDAKGNLATQPAATLVEVLLSFHDDVPGEKDVSRGEFTLIGPDPELKYAVSLDRPECNDWKMRLQLDDAGKKATLCFAVPAGAAMDPSQLEVDWGNVAMPLGKSQFNFSFGTSS